MTRIHVPRLLTDETLDPEDLTQRGALLGQIAALAALRDDLSHTLRERVGVARDDGCSWELIADAIGITQQQAEDHYR